MNEVHWVSVIAISEFALLMTAILVYLVTYLGRRTRRDNAAANELVERVKSNEADRGAQLNDRLKQVLGAEDGQELTALVQELLSAERGFYEDFLKTYLNHDSQAVSRMDVRLQHLTARYLELKRPATNQSQEDNEPAGGDSGAESAKFRDMADDLILYRDTLNRVFSEYTAMFGVHLDSTQELTAQEILQRLETGQLAGEEPEDSPAEETETSEDGEVASEQPSSSS